MTHDGASEALSNLFVVQSPRPWLLGFWAQTGISVTGDLSQWTLES